jgi:hypothetical protein
MVSAIRHLARWLVWQLGEPEAPAYERPASITVISTPSLRTRPGA